MELSFLVGFIAWIIEVLLHALQTEFRLFLAPLDVQLIDTMPARLIGVALVIVSLIIFIWALISFRDSRRIGIDEKTQGELIATEVFAISRNLVFILVDIDLISTFLINGTLIFLIFAVVVAIGLHYQIVQEEGLLAKTCGQVYQVF